MASYRNPIFVAAMIECDRNSVAFFAAERLRSTIGQGIIEFGSQSNVSNTITVEN